jgi:nitric oxide reductase NorE protein
VPGEPGIWIIIFGDMFVFSVMFLSFMVARRADLALFRASAAHLDQRLGLLNTVLLLTSSWCVAVAIGAARGGDVPSTVRSLRGAIACALGFVLSKICEYAAKVHAGIAIDSNEFYMYYFVLTGIHLMHVLVGLGVLTFMTRHAAAGGLDAVKLGHLESGASFWHLVDLLWIALFALLYLLP